MASYNPLKFNLQSPTTLEIRCALINQLWNVNLATDDLEQDRKYSSFFDYYEEQCAAAHHDGKNRMLIKTHQDLVDIAQEIRQKQATRSLLYTNLQSKLPTPDSLDKDELLFRNVAGPSQRTLQWKPDESLSNLLSREFSDQKLMTDNVKLGRLFTAQNIEQIGGIQIKWTSNLADHLRLLEDDTRVAIFHHASFLRAQESSDIFPPGLISETLRTLALLLPQHEVECRKWFKQQRIEYSLDFEAQKCLHLSSEDRQIHKFTYWHDRLAILKQTFDEVEPSTLYQWWSDRRRRVQWYTFWVAILVLFLTILFGLVQCIEGGMQVWKAFHP